MLAGMLNLWEIDMAVKLLAPTDPKRMLHGSTSDDVLTASTTGSGAHQVHLYADDGDDVINMNLKTTFSGGGIKHGFHVFGGKGADEFRFNNINGITGTVVSRIDDFDATRDSIYIGGQLLDLRNPSAIVGWKVAIVEFAMSSSLGAHESQQWLRIVTPAGQALIALEGARLDPGSSTGEEKHFIPIGTAMPAIFKEVPYQDPINFIPYDVFPKASHRYVNHGLGSDGGDTFWGTDFDDIYDGHRGADHIKGGAGNDTLYGYFGNDTINGGNGHDVIEGGKGRDLIYGGEGRDTIAGGTDQDVIYGGNGDDRIYGGSESDTLYGNEGSDYIDTGTGNDQVWGGDGRDTVLGGRGNDYLRGEKGNDAIQGGEGNDTLVGGLGSDTLNGDVGQDVFIYYSPAESPRLLAERDRIVNFQSGVDKINIFSMDADRDRVGLQAFNFNGGVAGPNSVWLVKSGSDVIVFADVDGDAVADFSVQLVNALTITVSDFVL